jgi:hypothetical protein
MRREVAGSIAELVRGGTRSTMTADDSKSGARFEWVVIDGERYVLKHQDVTDDWLMRATGDLGHRYVALWEHGILDCVPDVIDHATVGCAYDGRACRTVSFLKEMCRSASSSTGGSSITWRPCTPPSGAGTTTSASRHW